MKTIILHSEVKDVELLKDLRRALKKKGLKDMANWNEWRIKKKDTSSLAITKFDELMFTWSKGGKSRATIPVSRDDFQTMFLLY